MRDTQLSSAYFDLRGPSHFPNINVAAASMNRNPSRTNHHHIKSSSLLRNCHKNALCKREDPSNVKYILKSNSSTLVIDRCYNNSANLAESIKACFARISQSLTGSGDTNSNSSENIYCTTKQTHRNAKTVTYIQRPSWPNSYKPPKSHNQDRDARIIPFDRLAHCKTRWPSSYKPKKLDCSQIRSDTISCIKVIPIDPCFENKADTTKSQITKERLAINSQSLIRGDEPNVRDSGGKSFLPTTIKDTRKSNSVCSTSKLQTSNKIYPAVSGDSVPKSRSKKSKPTYRMWYKECRLHPCSTSISKSHTMQLSRKYTNMDCSKKQTYQNIKRDMCTSRTSGSNSNKSPKSHTSLGKDRDSRIIAFDKSTKSNIHCPSSYKPTDLERSRIRSNILSCTRLVPKTPCVEDKIEITKSIDLPAPSENEKQASHDDKEILFCDTQNLKSREECPADRVLVESESFGETADCECVDQLCCPVNPSVTNDDCQNKENAQCKNSSPALNPTAQYKPHLHTQIADIDDNFKGPPCIHTDPHNGDGDVHYSTKCYISDARCVGSDGNGSFQKDSCEMSQKHDAKSVDERLNPRGRPHRVRYTDVYKLPTYKIQGRNNYRHNREYRSDTKLAFGHKSSPTVDATKSKIDEIGLVGSRNATKRSKDLKVSDRNATKHHVDLTVSDRNTTKHSVNLAVSDRNATKYGVNLTVSDRNTTKHSIDRTVGDRNDTKFDINHAQHCGSMDCSVSRGRPSIFRQMTNRSDEHSIISKPSIQRIKKKKHSEQNIEPKAKFIKPSTSKSDQSITRLAHCKASQSSNIPSTLSPSSVSSVAERGSRTPGKLKRHQPQFTNTRPATAKPSGNQAVPYGTESRNNTTSSIENSRKRTNIPTVASGKMPPCHPTIPKPSFTKDGPYSITEPRYAETFRSLLKSIDTRNTSHKKNTSPRLRNKHFATSPNVFAKVKLSGTTSPKKTKMSRISVQDNLDSQNTDIVTSVVSSLSMTSSCYSLNSTSSTVEDFRPFRLDINSHPLPSLTHLSHSSRMLNAAADSLLQSARQLNYYSMCINE